MAVQGVGLGLRRTFAAELVRTSRQVDWLEILPENWVRAGRPAARTLDAARERWPIALHSVTLSLGGRDPLDSAWIAEVSALARRLDAPWWSDHLAVSQQDGRQTLDLLPLPYSWAAAEHLARRIQAAQAQIPTTLAVENISWYAPLPGAELDEATFLSLVLEQSGAHLMLDIHNVYINSLNHGGDPAATLAALPLDRVVSIHLAGHTPREGLRIDDHRGPVPAEVWDLYRSVLRRAGRMIPTLIEWDTDIPPLDQVLDEVDRARAEAAQALGGAP